jgi:hypothetical protein
MGAADFLRGAFSRDDEVALFCFFVPIEELSFLRTPVFLPFGLAGSVEAIVSNADPPSVTGVSVACKVPSSARFRLLADVFVLVFLLPIMKKTANSKYAVSHSR